MSIVNGLLQSETVVVFGDTLVLGGDLAVSFEPKVTYHAVAGVLVAGRGMKEAVDAFSRSLSRDFPGAGVHDLAELGRPALQKAWSDRYDPDLAEMCNTTAFLWGWDAEAERFAGYTLPSRNRFAPEPMNDGFLIGPGLDEDLEGVTFDDLDGIAVRQHDAEVAACNAGDLERRQIGGDLIAYQLQRGPAGTFCSIAPRFRFATYDEDLEEMRTTGSTFLRQYLGRLETRAMDAER